MIGDMEEEVTREASADVGQRSALELVYLTDLAHT